MTAYKLSNGEELARRFPTSFKMPPLAGRRNLRKGDFAKLVFDDAERMWVLITERSEPEPGGAVSYAGTLNNKPSVIDTVAFGDRIEFGPEHVIATANGA